MKKLALFLSIVFVSMTSFVWPSCEKENYDAITVNVTVFESNASVTLTGEQGQGTYVFDEYTSTHNLPNVGTYSITGTFGGGCGGYRVSTETNHILLVGPEGGSTTITGQTLEDQYYASVNCE